jgi:hypothetical protein
MESGAVGHNIEKDHPRRRRFKCDLLSKYA